MASNKIISCGPCQKEKLKSKADNWCYNCEEGLCSTCSGQHRRSKGTGNHKTIDIKSYKPSIQTIKTECDKHGQQLYLYCPNHLMPCCDQCVSIGHSKCIGIKRLASVVETTQIDKSTKKLDIDIKSTLKILNETLNNKSINIQRGEQQVDSIKETIVKYRKKINKHLDDLEKKLSQQTDTVFNQEKSKAADFITEIDRKQIYLKKMQEQLLSFTSHTSKLHSFLGMHQIELQVQQCQRYVENLEKDDRTKEFNIKMTENEEIENILSKLESLGEVKVVKTETVLNVETSVRREAQVETREHSNIKNMTMNIGITKKINIGKTVSDMICLMDGRVIIVEWFRNVYLITPDGEIEKQLPISDGSRSVTQINQNTIAVTYPDEKVIKIFNMENETVTREIRLDTQCYSLSFSNNSLAVGLKGPNIRIIDLEGNTLKSIPVQSVSILDHLVKCNERVIYSDSAGNAVYCYDESGKQIWKHAQDLSDPRGLCTDMYGNIIVADYLSGRIIVISKDGRNSKVLISEEKGNIEHWCICFKHYDSSGFICDANGLYLAKFNVSSG